MTSPKPGSIEEAELLQREMWYVGCTMARHEKSVADHFSRRGIEHVLPLYDTVHRWRNGRHHVQLPIFNGYIFVHVALNNRLRVLEVPGFAHFVSFGTLPTPISDAEIEAMRVALDSGKKVEPYPYLTSGTRVEIIRGPMQGLTGLLLRRRTDCRIVLSVDLIMRSMTVEVDASDVIPVREASSSILHATALPAPAHS